ncbi:MAG: choice-of-anchor D domain-containing protein, partial [Candidatus Latescibacterota bacterium]
AAEYFVDRDPGPGRGTALAAQDGAFGGDTEGASLDISTEGLAEGYHVLYVRYQDEDGTWGRPRGAAFQVRVPVSGVAAEHPITAGEYFVDQDPGQGNGVALEPVDGAWGGGLEDVVGRLETADLSLGAHTVSVRLQDSSGLWGRTRSVPFTVEPPPPERPDLVVDDAGPHDFGSLKIDTRGEWTFTVSNASGAADSLKVRAVEVAPPYAVSIASFTLAPGRSQRVTVTFSPAAEGTYAGTLTVRSNDVEQPRLEIRLSGRGVPEQPRLALSTPTLDHDFGAVRLGSTGEWPLVVSNEGPDTLRVSEVATGAPFAAAPGVFFVPPGGQQQVLVTFQPAAEGTVAGNLRIRANDPEHRETQIALSGEGVAYGVPVATVETPAGELSGAVAIRFSITDEDQSPVSLSFAYELGGTQHPATVSGLGGQVEAAQYAAGPLTATWETGTDLPGRDEVVRFVIGVRDAEHAEGKTAVSADFRVDNNQPPGAALTAPAAPVGRQVELASSLTDAERDPLSLAAAYSTDAGTTWLPATLASQAADVLRYADSVVWDAFADLGYGRRSVLFRLTPSDRDAGTPSQVALQVVHLAGDYDGDQDVDFEDLVLFLAAWNRTPRDASADIGPANGVLPDLLPAGDGRLDFEDVVVLLQMWNWSAGVYPTGKLAPASRGARALELVPADDHGHLLVDLCLAATPVLAGRFEIGYDPAAWALEAVRPAAGVADPDQLLVLWREPAPGQVRVEAGSLAGVVRGPGALLRLRFAPVGRGGDAMRVAYDLRDGAGLPQAAGAVEAHVRPTPSRSFLSANVPNPFNPETLIPYGLAEPSAVELVVYDVVGRRVRVLVPEGLQPAGYYRVGWDGRDESGRPVGSGVYFYRLYVGSTGEPGALVQTRRMLLLR